MNAITIGIDLAKSVFPVHGIDAAGAVVIRKKLRRAQMLKFFEGHSRCLIGMEACATAHFWARELAAFGHEVRLMPPSYVKAYLRRQKNDAADAEAICEAVTRPTMRFVPVKSAERQSVLVLHRSRELLVRQRTMLINAIRGHCAEFGIIAPQGPVVQVNLSSKCARPRSRPFRTWRDLLCRCWQTSSASWPLRSGDLSVNCWRGTVRIRRASSSPLSWVLSHGRTLPAARNG